MRTGSRVSVTKYNRELCDENYLEYVFAFEFIPSRMNQVFCPIVFSLTH
jgi:hypothetical protein